MDPFLYVNVVQNFKETGFVAIFAGAMNTCVRYCFILLFYLIATKASAQYIQVNDTYTAQELVEDVLINSSCASVSNFSVSGGNFASGAQSYGYFSGAGTTFPFANGIVLSTGSAKRTEGPNNSLLDEGNNMSWGGDDDLENALDINNSVNATILEFDFIPLGNKISFDYILSSEEYHDNAPCRYSDGFAFLLKEANTTNPYQNLAIVPGTSTPVKVTSVRPQISGSGGCPAENEEYFGGFNGQEHPTDFNGQTAVLTAEAHVTPGVQYHIKLVIADEGNYRYDSAIFLGGGSFQVTTDLGPDRLLATNNPACNGETITLDATTPGAINYTWYKGGVQQSTGAANNTFAVTTPGTYSVEVQLNGTCFSEGQVEIEYASAVPTSTQSLLQCDDNNDGLSIFNLDLADVLVNTDPNSTVTYYTSLPAANAGGNGTGFITNTAAFANTTPNQQVYARVQNQFGCYGVSTVTLATSANTVANPAALETCDDDGNEDGFHTFDLTGTGQDILQNLPPGLQLQYFATFADALSTENPIANPATFTNTTAYNQSVYARVYNGSDCYGIAEIDLVVFTFGNALQDETLTLCTNTTITLDPGMYSTYTWSTNPPVLTRTLTVSQPGTYTVTVTNANGCPGTKTYTVTASGPATDADIAVNDFAGNNNSVTITPVGPGSYEYSLDGIDYQQEPFFSDLDTGEYTIYIRDTNGCSPRYTEDVFVLDYPRFFTPNGDGENDYWHIPYLQFRGDAEITIFNRFGKLIHRLRGIEGWDGTYNGKPLPSTDYWFVLKFSDGRTIKGHFSMLR
jgi:gliding motility-associated-like protein